MNFREYMEKAITPYHTVAAAKEYLDGYGFAELPLTGRWQVEKGGKYYVNCHDSALAAFVVNGEGQLRLAGAHTDYPCLKLKPDAASLKAGFVRLNIEPYGGMIFSTWFDRPLGLAGKVMLRNADGTAKTAIVDFGRAVATVPNLAIHFNRGVNDGEAIKANRDLYPVCGLAGEEITKDYIETRLAKLLDCDADSILTYDLSFYLYESGEAVGFDGELWSAPRLDNITSVYACLWGIANTKRESGVSAIFLYDNEEVGSRTKQGAHGAMTETILEKLYLAMGCDRAALLDAYTGGMLLSCDVAHALHPNREDMYDSTVRSLMGKGLTLKLNFRQNYATDAEALAGVKLLCEKEGIPYSVFMNRPDLRGGGTISADTSSLLCISAVDAGVPILAMHSSRELMSPDDEEALCRLCGAFL